MIKISILICSLYFKNKSDMRMSSQHGGYNMLFCNYSIQSFALKLSLALDEIEVNIFHWPSLGMMKPLQNR